MKWNESNAAKSYFGKYAQHIFNTSSIILDASTPQIIELVGTKEGQYFYLRFEARPGTKPEFYKLSETARERFVANEVIVLETAADFRAFAEARNDNRLRKLGV